MVTSLYNSYNLWDLNKLSRPESLDILDQGCQLQVVRFRSKNIISWRNFVMDGLSASDVAMLNNDGGMGGMNGAF